MSYKSETSDLAALSGSALLDHYLESVQNSLSEVISGTKSLDELKQSKMPVELIELRKAIGMTSGNLLTSRNLVLWINKLIRQLTRPYEYKPLTMTCISKVHQMLDWAILGHYNKKEAVVDDALVAILEKTHVLKRRNVISDYFRRLMKGNQEEEMY